MKTLLKIALIAIVAVLGYNYFYGDEKEQEQAERIVGKVKDLGSDLKALVLNEKEKYNEGKYDKTVEKFNDLISSVKEKISSIDLEKLEKRKDGIEESLKKLKKKTEDVTEEETKNIESEMQELLEDISKAIEDIEI